MLDFVLVELQFVSVEPVLSQVQQMISLRSKLKNVLSSGKQQGKVLKQQCVTIQAQIIDYIWILATRT